MSNPTATESGTGTNKVALIQGATAGATDVDALNFAGGTITVTLDNYRPGDRLSMSGSPIGVALAAGGNGAALTITLNAAALQSNIGAIIEAIRFENTGDDPTVGGTDADRVYSIVLNDGGNSPAPGQNSNTLMGTITLVDEIENTQASATNTSQVIGYNEDDPTVAIADIVVTDADVGEMITATLTLADTGARGAEHVRHSDLHPGNRCMDHHGHGREREHRAGQRRLHPDDGLRQQHQHRR